MWALYDDAQSSYKNAIKKYFDGEIEVHSVGINDIVFTENENYFYHKIDLSLANFNLFKELSQLPKPDFIFASPPCESWSGADCNGKMFRSIDEDNNWRVMNKRHYDEYNKTCHPVKRRYFLQKEQGRILGESTLGATISIIEHFKPKIWIIENPQTSKMWEFQRNHWGFTGPDMFENLAYYSAYDENFSPKPTIFKSNVKLNLHSKRVAGNKEHMAKGSYSKRSSIPSELIKSIVGQILEKN